MSNKLEKSKAKDLRTLTQLDRDIMYEDLSRRILERHSRDRICSEMGISASTLDSIRKSKKFRKTFALVHKRIYAPVEAAMIDERMEITKRIDYMSQRGLTALGVALDRFINGTELETKDPETGKTKYHQKVKAGEVVQLFRELAGRNEKTPEIRRQINQGTQHLSMDPETAEVFARVMKDVEDDAEIIDITPEDVK